MLHGLRALLRRIFRRHSLAILAIALIVSTVNFLSSTAEARIFGRWRGGRGGCSSCQSGCQSCQSSGCPTCSSCQQGTCSACQATGGQPACSACQNGQCSNPWVNPATNQLQMAPIHAEPDTIYPHKQSNVTLPPVKTGQIFYRTWQEVPLYTGTAPVPDKLPASRYAGSAPVQDVMPSRAKTVAPASDTVPPVGIVVADTPKQHHVSQGSLTNRNLMSDGVYRTVDHKAADPRTRVTFVADINDKIDDVLKRPADRVEPDNGIWHPAPDTKGHRPENVGKYADPNSVEDISGKEIQYWPQYIKYHPAWNYSQYRQMRWKAWQNTHNRNNVPIEKRIIGGDGKEKGDDSKLKSVLLPPPS